MPTTITQATVGAGKTEIALHQLSDVINSPDKPFAQAWILVATKRQEIAFRQRLAELNDGRSIYFNIEFFQFGELYTHLLNIAGIPFQRINEPTRIGILKIIIEQLNQTNQLNYFANINQSSGFINIIAEFIYELKQNMIRPEDFITGAITQKDAELALIYNKYQTVLRDTHLVDREGEGWLALESLKTFDQLPQSISLMLVDGFDQFTPLQAQLLAQLSPHIPNINITLTSVPQAQNTIGRRFERAKEQIEQAHQDINEPITINSVDSGMERQPDLDILVRHIAKPKIEQSKPIELNAIQLISVPECRDEAIAVLRDIKHKLLNGVRPDDILIALRDWTAYQSTFEYYGRIFELPLLNHYSDSIAKNPALTILLDILQLAQNDFKRNDVLKILRSPYITVQFASDEFLTPRQIELLTQISSQQQVLKGKDEWLDAVKVYDSDIPDWQDDEHDKPTINATREEIDELSLNLETFFSLITPPKSNSLIDYVQWIESLIGIDPILAIDDPDLDDEGDIISLNILKNIRANTVGNSHIEQIIKRDLQALARFKDILSGYLMTQMMLESTLGISTWSLTWSEFISDLQTLIHADTSSARNPMRSGRVLVTTASNARGLPHAHVYVLGLAEGLFPAKQSEDSLYLDSERRALQANGIELQTQDERADDQGLFYELINLARQTLTLTRPTIQNNKPWNESHLWRMVQQVFEKDSLSHRHITIGELPTLDIVASPDEAILSASHLLSARDTLSDDESIVIQALKTNSQTASLFEATHQGRIDELQRLSNDPHDKTSGIIENDELQLIIQNKLNDEYTWSASQFNQFGKCAYQFFAKRLLKLEKWKEPTIGLDVMQLGTINHEILEQTYRDIKDAGFPIHADYLDEALEIFYDNAPSILKTAPQKFQIRVSGAWQQERELIIKRLDNLIRADFSLDSPLKTPQPRYPYRFEQLFGFGTHIVEIPIGHGIPSLKVRGAIDRIDRVGDDLYIIDYKTGTKKFTNEMLSEGTNFQMMVYILALNEILKQWDAPNLHITGGVFWHIRNTTISGELKPDPTAKPFVIENTFIDQAQAHLARYIERARQADFAVQPHKIDKGKCDAYCDYYQLCRLSSTHPYKLS